MIQACRQAAEFFAGKGMNNDGYQSCQIARKEAEKLTDRKELEIAQCEYNLGVYAQRLGNVRLSQTHHRESLRIRESNTEATAEDMYLSCNAMGGIYWYTSKYDSAALFFEKALDNLSRMPDNDMNRYYRPATINNNLAGLYSIEGRTTDAIRAMEACISSFQKFIDTKNPHPKKEDARLGILEGIDNLAGLYKEVGDYGKAGSLLKYAYEKKREHFNAGHPGIFISEILMGQHYNSINEYDSAQYYLTSGLEKLEKAEGDYLFWAGDGYYNLAMVYENRKDRDKASYYYEKAGEKYESAFQGEYDNVYMDFMRNAALFYAKNNQYEKAIGLAKKVFDYLKSVNQEKSLQAFYQLLNMAEVTYHSSRYREAIDYSFKALTVVNEKVTANMTVLDSVKIEVFKPKAILVNEQARFALQENRDSLYLTGVADRLQKALDILEKRKVLIDDAESINILIADNAELIDFAKKIELELYEKTHQSAHLDRFINLHESGLYTRIRSRLDKKKAIRFSQLPLAVQQEEDALKTALQTALLEDKPYSELISNYLNAVKNWDAFLEKVKRDHPVYYKMRYASLFRSLDELKGAIPAQTTLVRYFFAGDQLVALVADSMHQSLIKLDPTRLDQNIALLLQNAYAEKPAGKAISDLYKSLWEPLAPSVKTKKLMIIPDDRLYSLNFELLTPDTINNYRDLIKKSLLSRYDIAYHYSLFMLENQKNETAIDNNYVGFAPGFSDDIKKAYLASVKDSVQLDRQYLSLLPQPNTNKLAKKFQGLLGGQAYLNLASTPSVFRKNAGGHKIIHIGTHAEYNNIYPERSRLIFAKTPSVLEDTNSIFLYDVYNCDVRSELTLLTACETGRPGYRDGEGMISLAHAFNFAGSRSILTGIWKIDEASSSRITEIFIQQLQQGIPTDEALRAAKLDYIANNPDRLLAPAYWSGLILMGQPASIQFEKKHSWWWWVLGGLVLLGGVIAALRNKK